MISPLKPIFDEMMKPSWLHYLLYYSLPRGQYSVFEALSELRKELLSTAFLHPEKEESQARQSLYWKNQIALFRQKGERASIHPALERLAQATQGEERLRALEIVEAFLYESQSHLELLCMRSQRNRWTGNIGRLGEALVPATGSAKGEELLQLRASLQWCLKVTLYQYRGLLTATANCNTSLWHELREEIIQDTPKCTPSALSLKIYIRYHQFLWSLVFSERLEATDSYARPSTWGIIRFLCSLVF